MARLGGHGDVVCARHLRPTSFEVSISAVVHIYVPSLAASCEGGMLPVPSAMLDGRKMSKHGASRRSAGSVVTLDNDDVLLIDTLPSVSYDPSVKEIESDIKDMKGTEDMPKYRHTVNKDGNPILLRPDGRKCRLCSRRDDQWDPVWLAKFRRHQQLHQRQQQQQPHQQPQPATTPKAMSSNSKNSNSIQS